MIVLRVLMLMIVGGIVCVVLRWGYNVLEVIEDSRRLLDEIAEELCGVKTESEEKHEKTDTDN